MVPIRTLHADDFPVARLREAKGATTVAVCLPARDEAATVGAIVERIRVDLADTGLIDDLVVVDDHSSDDTAAVAAAAGARVIAAADTDTDGLEANRAVTGPGKGQALWKSLRDTDADVVAWCDADLSTFGSHFVTGLIGPLLTDEATAFVKATYERPLVDGRGGGRVTELLARPLLATLVPDLATLGQPLAGEYAGRRSVLETVPFVAGYGVDIGLLIDIVHRCGPDAIVQVDLGERHHRNRPLHQLSVQASEVLQGALGRAHANGVSLADVHDDTAVTLRRPGRDPVAVVHRELPPLTAARR